MSHGLISTASLPTVSGPTHEPCARSTTTPEASPRCEARNRGDGGVFHGCDQGCFRRTCVPLDALRMKWPRRKVCPRSRAQFLFDTHANPSARRRGPPFALRPLWRVAESTLNNAYIRPSRDAATDDMRGRFGPTLLRSSISYTEPIARSVGASRNDEQH